ncbi:class I SAM-dependent DNA methyltransferase [Borreliella burgdorferi]|uniref:class I SAM-dependent DNA methyltransferase n=1 Tax=Borreliella burgdorferi TaxID=139 RepID=UPI00016B2DC4|nr:class I SAM-dependent DNA methyltransferase [Borreliella burgdorferi]ACL34132.1 putative type I restriction/modofication enzyme [Borreliella burgdorferi 156a]MCD2408660.1 class I SAM-dependent DNA methyltransferase [Borreliella burgdorferi]MCR8909918.1 class I SAM-dependent DNA methyltransferase [Borreliella burgdorferi 297]MDK7383858.1 class I SAM-dependent DNA methyltransferase [Borreliella burgdorferi]MDO7256860.1 class I SAM-dependent DNA methyltransferase [Borreliella burgdorferi]
MKTNDIVKTNNPNISLYKQLSKDFIKKENINKLKDFFILMKNKLFSIDDNSTEANIESLLKYIFEELNYSVEQQKAGQIEGVESRVDILLFESDKDKASFNNKLKEAKKNNEPIPVEDILIIAEVKRPKFSFDAKDKLKESEDQLYRYLNQYQKHYGILSNGKVWRLYDKSKVLYGEKRYIEFNFSKIEEKEEYREQEWFVLFIYLIRKERYLKTSNVIEVEKEQIAKEKEIIQKTLKEILYERPDDSIVFKIAKSIYDKEFKVSDKEITQHILASILEESIIFILRIFFIAYIEDNDIFKKILQENKLYRSSISFRYFFYDENTKKKLGYKKIITIFNLLDKGSDAIKFPVFNGGLFSEDKVKYLNNESLLSISELEEILIKILFFEERNIKDEKFIEYSKLDPKSFGELYETLLEYDLRIADTTVHRIVEDGAYLIRTEEELKNKKANKVATYYKGNIYLTSRSLDRKKSGAYYTPDDLTDFMITSSIEEQLKTKSPLDIKIIDNSCGSGHFLISCLDYLAEKVWYQLDKFEDVKKELDKEYRVIIKESEEYDVQDSISKELVLKRMLLKKCIYGVDINPISVEITMLSLWINTFIFGTPLSFIEHHIKAGNALLGYTKDEFFDIVKKKFESGFSLFKKRIKEIITILGDIYQKIKGINDTTKEDIEKSKKIYKEYEESKDIDNLRIVFSLIKLYSLSFDKSLNIEFSDIASVISLIENILGNKTSSEDKEKIEKIRKLSSYYKFFHYGIEFPDIQEGFDIVIGNPPWEKTKFNETEFFSKHIPNYRKLGIKEQNSIKQEILSKDNHPLSIEYNEEKNSIIAINNIYKFDFKYFTSGGDPNLFRYFVTFNLKLIKEKGNLTYLVPSAIWNESSSRILRKHIFARYKLNYIYQFENKKRFKDVDSRFKFAIFQLSNIKESTSSFKAKFMIQSSDNILKEIIRDLKDSKDDAYKGIELNINQIKKLSPIQESIIEFKDNEEFTLINKMFSKFSTLGEGYIDFKKGLDPSIKNRKSLLKEYNNRNLIFLYSGANIHQFNSRFFEDKDAKESSKLLWIDKEDLEKVLTKDNQYQTERVFYRAIARNTDERTMISTLSPGNCYCVNSIYINYEKTPVSLYKKLFIISIFNSFVFDFLLRRFVDSNVLKSCLYQCPMPQPEEKEILSNPLYLNLVKNTSLLIAKNDPENFKYLLYLEYFEFDKGKVNKILNLNAEDEFFKEKENENNFIIASLYSLSKEDFITLLGDFKALKNKKKGEDYISSLIKGYDNYLLNNKIF